MNIADYRILRNGAGFFRLEVPRLARGRRTRPRRLPAGPVEQRCRRAVAGERLLRHLPHAAGAHDRRHVRLRGSRSPVAGRGRQRRGPAAGAVRRPRLYRGRAYRDPDRRADGVRSARSACSRGDRGAGRRASVSAGGLRASYSRPRVGRRPGGAHRRPGRGGATAWWWSGLPPERRAAGACGGRRGRGGARRRRGGTRGIGPGPGFRSTWITTRFRSKPALPTAPSASTRDATWARRSSSAFSTAVRGGWRAG